MAKRPRLEPPGIDWDQARSIQQKVLDSYDQPEAPSSTPAPPPSGSSAAVPISPGGLGMRGGKAGGFWYNKGGSVTRPQMCKGGKVISTRSF